MDIKELFSLVNIGKKFSRQSGRNTTDIKGQAERWAVRKAKLANYDVVIGNIANDNVGETVSYVLQGIMRKEDAVGRLKFEKINNQIAFCTEASLKELVYKGFYKIEV